MEKYRVFGIFRGEGYMWGLFSGFARKQPPHLLPVMEMDLLKALRSGQSVAQLAEEKGIGLDILVNTVLDQHAETLTKAVEAGKITQEQADQRLQTLKEQLTRRFEDGDWRFTPGNNNRGDNSRNDGASL